MPTFESKATKLVAVLLLLASSGLALAGTRIEKSYDKLKSAEQALMESHPTDLKKSVVMKAAYENLIGPAQADATLHELSNEDLLTLYSAAKVAAFYTLDRKYVLGMVADVNELSRRGVATDSDLNDTYNALLGVRDFDNAQIFSDTHSGDGIRPPPIIVGKKGGDAPGVLTFRGPEIERMPVNLESGSHLIVVGHPTCHFTQIAVGDIERDAKLSALFSRFAIWIAPQDLKLTADLYRSWNATHPLAALSLVDERSAWPAEIDDWSTPTFYFFHDGKLAAKVIGWPKDGRRQALLDAFRASGMSIPSNRASY